MAALSLSLTPSFGSVDQCKGPSSSVAGETAAALAASYLWSAGPIRRRKLALS